MADSNRKAIWQKVEAALKEITEAAVTFGMPDPGGVKIISIIPGTDGFSRSSKLTNRSRLEFVLRVIWPSLYEYEDVAPLIKAKMTANRKWDALAYDTLLEEEKWLYPDAQPGADTGVDMHYSIEYDP